MKQKKRNENQQANLLYFGNSVGSQEYPSERELDGGDSNINSLRNMYNGSIKKKRKKGKRKKT